MKKNICITLLLFICFNFQSTLAQSLKNDNLVSVDTITGQLKTVEMLKKMMNEKKYDEAVLLFSKQQRQKINKIKNDPEIFNYWCLAWTLDEAKYDRYTKRIKAGKGKFVFEDNEWKIDEK